MNSDRNAPTENMIDAFNGDAPMPAPQTVAVLDERKAAEHAYVISAFNYEEAPVGSRDWTLFWSGWQKRAALFATATPAKVVDAESPYCQRCAVHAPFHAPHCEAAQAKEVKS